MGEFGRDGEGECSDSGVRGMLDPEESLFENGLCMEGQRNRVLEGYYTVESLLARKRRQSR